MDSNSNLEPIWGFFLELFSSRGSADRSPAELLQSSDRPTRVFEGGPSGHPKAFVAQVFHLDRLPLLFLHDLVHSLEKQSRRRFLRVPRGTRIYSSDGSESFLPVC